MGRLTRCSAILGALGLVACSTSSHVVVGTVRPPVPPVDVRVYMQPPSKYETIATINATSQGSLALTSQQNMDKAIERMKEEAGKLGANGVLLQGVSDQQTGSIGTGVGSSSYGPSSSTGVGVGGSFGLTNKATSGLAIYVPPDAIQPEAMQHPPMQPAPVPPPPPVPPPHG